MVGQYSATHPKAQCEILRRNSTIHLGPQNNVFRVSSALFQTFGVSSQRTEIAAISGSSKQLRNHSEKSSFGLLGRLRLHIGNIGLLVNYSDTRCRVDSKLFSQNDYHSHLRRAIWVYLTNLGPNDDDHHQGGSLGCPKSR
ncbi:hypothetical protein CRG98_040807 [Punica granatum]|uniref:Uncharacterized protein n=1 Tax=Punica granatum TaxID=22663 RepID=A0A2I0I4B4_PUNGR|nr:hypothetical protein CRG98_040807 [Punica granatum]